MRKLSIDDLQLKGKKVLVRVDFNVPLDENNNITDDIRIVRALPTIKKIVNDGGIAVLMSHLGRPKGVKDDKFSLKPVAVKLDELLNTNVKFANDCIGEHVRKVVNSLEPGEVLLLENLRFHSGETKNDPEFAKELAEWGEIYINDAFGTAHRAHASTVGVTKYFEQCAAGYLMEKELEYLSRAVLSPDRPFTAILGGAKVSDKIEVIKNLFDKVNTLIIGGGMAFTFFKAMNYKIGKSILEEDKIDLAKDILKKAGDSKISILLPSDVVIASEFKNDTKIEIVPAEEIPDDKIGLDIGPQSIDLFKRAILYSKTIVWNGPMGVFEFENFARGTFEIAKAMAEATQNGATTIIGGGDSAAAIKKAGLSNQVSHVSTGGGASLEFLEGKLLPGVEALTDA